MFGDLESGLVIKGIPDKIPPGAILISKDEAQRRQWAIVTNWLPSKEVWALKYGLIITTVAVGVTSIMITSYYRKRLKLGTYGQLTTHIPTVFVPCFLSGLLQSKLVGTPIVLQEQCPICIQVRSSAISTFCGTILPGILAPLASFGYAYHLASIRLPDVNLKNAKEYLKLYWQFTSRYQTKLGFMVAGHALLASFIAYKGGHQFYRMHLTMLNDRAEVEEKVYGKVSDSLNVARSKIVPEAKS